MELQQLRYVVAVAEERSFTRAGERCFVVQSALSHQVKALERELGVTLFARTSRRVEPTAAGEAFLIGARAALAAAERAVSDAAAASGRIRGQLSIGTIPTVTAIDLPATLGRFREAYPEVKIRLRSAGSDELVADLISGGLDVAFLGLPTGTVPEGVRARELSRDRLCAVVGAGHRFADRRRLRLGDLAEETFVDFTAGTPGRAQSDLAFAAAGLTREVTFETMSTELMLALVQQGLAVAFLARAVVPEGRGVRTIAVTGGPSRVEYLAWSDFNPSPAARAFLGLLDQPRP
ncbi:LysR family transcriptional regulator [Naumannella sp. ID2617S]|nr:LysR family transcriptional regulator [Naumannella sp. ID2617S]